MDPDDEVLEMPFVCPGCYAVGDAPHLSWCIDDERDREREEAIQRNETLRSNCDHLSSENAALSLARIGRGGSDAT